MSNVQNTRRIVKLEEDVHALNTELGRKALRHPVQDVDAGYGTVKGYVRQAATAEDDTVLLWDLERRHKPDPPDVKMGERTDEGTFACENIFKQSWQVEDIAVAFETQGETVSVTPSPGLAEQSADDLAAQTADGLSGLKPTTSADVTGNPWWAFKPGAQGGYALHTNSTVPVAVKNGTELLLGQGTAVPYTPQSPGEPHRWDYGGNPSVPVYNMARNEGVANGKDIQCKVVNDLLVIDWEECPPGS